MAAKKTFPWCDKYQTTTPVEMTAEQRHRNELQVEWLRKAVDAQSIVPAERSERAGHASAK